ncbi:hypothetical protein ABZ568_08920 [Streptomyces olindensis]|uniref:Uncharacterized protein n=1 Tax=Streptomyces olindensis TaxID=358823 RepID=A0ABV2XRC4_9ACTN
MVLWAERPVRVDVAGVAYDLMGRRLPTGPVTASGDPLYVVSPAVAGVTASSLRATARPRARLSRAEHIVLAQRFPARNAAPGKDDGDAPPPYGYRLGRRTRMVVDVYNFGATACHVTVAARPVGGGWSVRTEHGRQEERIRVPAGGRVGVGFTIRAGSSVRPRTDRRLAFAATLDEGGGVPASVALIHLK